MSAQSEAKEQPANVWEEYERRKAELRQKELPAADYERAVKAIAEELGL